MMIDDEALGWVIRLRDPSFNDWESFEAWMAASPAHAEAYQTLALADQDMDALLESAPSPMRAVVAPERRVTRRAWIGGAVAASLAAVIGLQVMERMPQPYDVMTAPGERRNVTLGDGSVVALNGGTTVTFDRKDARLATLVKGEAEFAVVHNEAQPFRVLVGDATLLDVGTRFDVLRDEGRTRVQVAEGAVVYNPKSEAIRLDPGRAIEIADGGAARTFAVPAGTVGGWRRGQWSYDGATLKAVANDLSRWSGRPVTVAPAVAGMTFRGAISLKAPDDIGGIGPAIGATVERAGEGWSITAPR